MKFRKFGQICLATVVSLVLMFGTTSCMNDFTVGFVFAIGNQYNQIASFKESSETGALTPAPGSPFGSGGTNPIRTFVLSGGRYLYVLNQGAVNPGTPITYSGANITLFSIGGNGILSAQPSYTSQGFDTIRMLPDTTGKFLFALDEYAPISTSGVTPQSQQSADYPCKNPADGLYYPTGDITVFTIDPNTGRLSIVTNQQQQNPNGTQLTYFPVGCFPVDFTVTAGFIFTADGGAASNNDSQTVFPYALNATSGQLTLTQNAPLTMGTTQMSAISTAQGSALSGSKYIYVLDAGANCATGVTPPGCSGEILPFTAGTNGSLQALTNGAVANDSTAANPVSLVVDSKSKYLYVVNAGPTNGITNPTSQITAWTIDPTNGTLQSIAGEPFGSGSGVNCVVEDPSNQYIYSTSFNDSQITGRILDPNTGNLTLLRRGSTFNAPGNTTWCAVSGRTT
jgi:6-phosphogluconolactonase (cycloisomerase 2 family)